MILSFPLVALQKTHRSVRASRVLTWLFFGEGRGGGQRRVEMVM